MTQALRNQWYVKIVLAVAFLLTMIAFAGLMFPAIISAQEQNQRYDVLYTPDAGIGFSGGSFEFQFSDAERGFWGDLNCSGQMDFDDVIVAFQAVRDANFPPDCRTVGEILRVVAVESPDYGIVDSNFGDADGTISFADLADLIPVDSGEVVLFTIVYDTVAPGFAPLSVRSTQIDGTGGVPMTPFVLETSVLAR